MRLLVEVTAEDIRFGIPAECSQCAVARAANRAIRPVAEVEPGVQIFHELAGGHWLLAHGFEAARLPGAVVRFVRAFDDPTVPNPAPFAFEIDLALEAA